VNGDWLDHVLLASRNNSDNARKGKGRRCHAHLAVGSFHRPLAWSSADTTPADQVRLLRFAAPVCQLTAVCADPLFVPGRGYADTGHFRIAIVIRTKSKVTM
jgi:hypothetical protein